MPQIERRRAVSVKIGSVVVGSDAPVVVQSMTNTDTADVLSTVQQIAALARAGSELVRVTVNNDAAAKAVPAIVEGIRAKGWETPIIGDFHYNGHLLLTKYPEAAQALAKYRINPGNCSIGRKDDDNFRTMVEVAVKHQKPVRIGVNWGSLDQALLTKMMDENSKLADPLPAREVMMEAMVVSALDNAAAAERYGLRRDQIILSAKVSGVRDLIDVYSQLGCPLRLCAAPGTDRGRHGHEGRGCLNRRAVAPAAGGNWRYDSRFAHSDAGWRSQRGGALRAADSAVAGHTQLYAAGDQLPRLRANHLNLLPGAGRTDSELPGGTDARVEEAIRGSRGAEAGRDGLRGQWAGRVEAREHRHLAAGNVRGTEGPGVRGWQAVHHAEGRPHRRGVSGDPGRVRGEALRSQS